MAAKLYIIQNCHVGEKLDILKGSCNSQGSNPVGFEMGDIPVPQEDFASFRLIKAVDTIQQAGLTGAVGSDNRKYLPFPDAGGYTGQRL